MIDDFDGLFKSSRLEQIYIMDLFSFNNAPFTNNPNQMNVQAKLRGQYLQHYTFDMRTLADSLTSRETSGGYKYIQPESNLWKPMFVEKLKHKQADNQISPVSSFNPVNSFAHLTSTKLQTNFSIQTYPITTNFIIDKNSKVNDYNNEFLKFQYILYRSFILPAQPLLFTTSSDNANFLGPQFVNYASISVENDQSVNISLETMGGRVLKSGKKNTTPINKNFRTMKNYDCAIDWVAHKKAKDFFEIIDRKTPASMIKIVSMNLEVRNNYNLKATGLGPYDLNKLGPRFITLNERTVQGSIKFIASSSEFPTNLQTPLGYNGLTLYFGGCFLFVLPNILWQKPLITLVENNLYFHEYSFIAFAADTSKANAFKAYLKGKFDISEFSLPQDNPTVNLELMAAIRQKAKENA